MSDVSQLLPHIRDVPDFPKEGIVFKDITPMLQDPKAFQTAVDMAAEPLMGQGIDVVLGAEARGFIIAAPPGLQDWRGLRPRAETGKAPLGEDTGHL